MPSFWPGFGLFTGFRSALPPSASSIRTHPRLDYEARHLASSDACVAAGRCTVGRTWKGDSIFTKVAARTNPRFFLPEALVEADPRRLVMASVETKKGPECASYRRRGVPDHGSQPANDGRGRPGPERCRLPRRLEFRGTGGGFFVSSRLHPRLLRVCNGVLLRPKAAGIGGDSEAVRACQGAACSGIAAPPFPRLGVGFGSARDTR